jgi:hypothetical protein
MLKSERDAKLEELKTALQAFIERERNRLTTEQAFLKVVQDLSTGKIDKQYSAATKFEAVKDAKSLLGLR